MWTLLAALMALPAPLDSLDSTFGPSQTVASASNGLLAIGVGSRGDLTALRWPGPLGLDQMHFLTALTTEGAPVLARGGAAPDQGLFVGLRFEQDGESWVEWLHQDDWSAQVTYLSDSSDVIRVDYHSLRHQADASVEYWLAVDHALLAVHAELINSDGRASAVAWLLHENLAPCDRRVAGQANTDWRDDDPRSPTHNDFAALYSEAADAVVHFRPADAASWQAQLAPRISAISADEHGRLASDAIVDELAREAVEGLFFTLGADHQSQALQVGRVDPEDRARPRDAYFDASDGPLSMQPAAMGSVNAVLEVRRRASAGGRTFYLAAGSTLGESLQELEHARLLGLAALTSEVEQRDRTVERSLASARTDSDSVDRVVRRSLRTLLLAQDPASGALALAVAAQPPLALDCASRTALAGEALELAGQLDRSEAHQRFYARVVADSRSSSWPGWLPGCVDAKGLHAAGADHAIDATALNLWAWTRLPKTLRDAGLAEQASRLVADLADVAQLSAQALMTCVDEATGLTCDAASDGQALHPGDLLAAAVTVAALEGAGEVFTDGNMRAAWAQRATELRGAAITERVDAQGQLQGSARARALAMYPGRLLRDDDRRRQLEMDRLLDEVESTLALTGSLDGDLAQVLWSLLHASDGDEPRRDRLRPLVLALIDLADPELAQYGALARPADSNGDGQVDVLRNQTARPYMPASALVYANAIVLLGTKPALDQQGPIDTCFCRQRTASSRQGASLVALLFLMAGIRRRRDALSGEGRTVTDLSHHRDNRSSP